MTSLQPDGGETPPQTPIFILSAGRTGSTFLARVIRSHPRILCVSDIIEPVGVVPYFSRTETISGLDFWRILAAPSLKQRIDYWRHKATDELLYLPGEDDLVSLLLTYTLPFLSDDPKALYQCVKEAVSSFPPRTPADQLTAFCDYLRDHFGKEIWVERTGGSLPHARQIVETWPEGKYIYNVRHPHETAISMMTGSFFRLYLALTQNPQLEDWDWDYMPPLAEMGSMLDTWIRGAETALENVPRERKQLLRYEDLMQSPAQVLLDLVGFIFEREPDATDRAWAEEQSQRVRPAPLRFEQLSRDEQDALAAACRISSALLGYAPAEAASR